jgi:hypothetical protein
MRVPGLDPGIDPRIHAALRMDRDTDRWIAGSSPVMTREQSAVLRWWFALMTLGGFGFGLLAERRPFGDDVLAHPFVVYSIVAGIALLLLRALCARPVPELIPERMLLLGCFAGAVAFLAGNFLMVHFIALL